MTVPIHSPPLFASQEHIGLQTIIQENGGMAQASGVPRREASRST